MRSSNINNVARRIQRLEASLFCGARTEVLPRLRGDRGRSYAISPITLRFGHLRRLPEEYSGERHVEIVKHLPDRDGKKWVEFAEVPGPDPKPPEDPGIPEYLDIIFVEPYPLRGQ